MKQMQRVLWMLLALTLLAFGAPALAEEAVWAYDAYNLCLNVSGDLAGDVVIPAEVDGCEVTAIRSRAFDSRNDVTSLTMPDTLRALQDSAVSYMSGLTEVRLNDGLEYIGYGNFSYCPALTSVTVPSSVRAVNAAFRACDNLREICFEGECPLFLTEDWCFNLLPEDCVIYVPDDQLEAYAAALADANDAADRLQPSGKNAVARPAEGNEDWFDFDASTGTINSYTEFHAWLEIPASIGGVAVKAIGQDAFRGDYSVYALILPEGLERIEEAAFQQASNMDYLSLPTTLRVIGDNGFMNAQPSRIDWSEGLEEIGAGAFRYAQASILSLPSTVRVIGDNAFESAWCEELYLGANVERIGSRAFAGTFLNYMAFDLYQPIDIAADAFADTQVADLDLPWDSSLGNRDAYAAMLAEQCPDCTVWINNPISGGVASYPVDSVDVTTIENGMWTAYHGDQPDLTVWAADGDIDITALGDCLFKGNQTIRSFYPHHCGWFTTIGAEAFADSSVAYVEMFPSITTIGDEAFRNCVNITEMTLPESLTSIGAGAFRGCTGITELTLPASLTSIGSGALDGCTGLEKLTVLCDPALLPQDMADMLAGVAELYAAPDATKEQVRTLSALAGRAWYNPVPRLGEEPAQVVAMPYAALPGDDFWYDEEYARLDAYQGYELNLYLPREIDGVQLTMIGGNMMSRACWGDNFDVELPVVSLVIPETYTDIPMYAFQNCDTLETVICYAPIENLPEGLFSGCISLREVVFVNGVRNIDRYVFDSCASLETVYLGGYVENVSEYAFLNMDQTEAFSLEKCITDASRMPNVDALLSAVKSEPMPTPEPTATPAPAVPVGPEGEPYLGLWIGLTMEMEGSAFSLADFGIVMQLTLNEDGTLLMFDGEEEEASTWTVSGGVITVDTMQGVLLDDGSLSLEVDGTKVIFTREGEGSAPVSTPAPAVPVGYEGSAFLGTWYGQTMEMEGSAFSLADFGIVMQLTFNEDGTMTLFDGEEEDTGAWTVSGGVALIDGSQAVLQADGTLCMEEDGTKVIFTREDEASAPVSTPAPAAPVGDGGAAFFGTWYGQTMEMEGSAFSLADFGLVMQLTFNEDGTMTLFDGEEEDTGTWTVSGGVALIDGTQAVLQGNGTLCMEEDGVKIVFTRDGEASAPVAPAETEHPAAGGANDFSDRLEVKYVLETADVQGYTMSASMLGGMEYSLTFHENGTADFVLSGAMVSGLTWTQQRVTTEDGEADAFIIDYYGTPLNVILTEEGCDLNYFDSMLMHFVAE
ncbi:MAG: leucine-rich repeat protein [Eubacteriales bacterium]|nr:leucine-rich repeat protein [Eubacteriales bacterium]